MSENHSKLSFAVGIPTHNNEYTIRETLESLISQTRLPDRIIVVDASDDRTPDIVREIDETSDVPIELVSQSKGRGVGGARQEFYDRLEEDILGCLDTQKRVDEDWVERRLDFHASNPEYAVLSGAGVDDELDRPASGAKDPYFLRQSNCSIRKSALDTVDGWDPWMGRGEDWDLRIRLWTAGSQAYVKSSLGCEFIESDSPTAVVTKIFARPSSVDFLRKYGRWYLQFHPIHVLGDLSSLVSLVALFVAPLMAFIWPIGALATLAVPLLGSVTYLYVKTFRGRRGLTDLRPIHLVVMARFFVLGITALRQLVTSSDTAWNYGGFDSAGPPNTKG